MVSRLRKLLKLRTYLKPEAKQGNYATVNNTSPVCTSKPWESVRCAGWLIDHGERLFPVQTKPRKKRKPRIIENHVQRWVRKNL